MNEKAEDFIAAEIENFFDDKNKTPSKVNIVVLGDINIDTILYPIPSEEIPSKEEMPSKCVKSYHQIRRFGGTILLGELIRFALNQWNGSEKGYGVIFDYLSTIADAVTYKGKNGEKCNGTDDDNNAYPFVDYCLLLNNLDIKPCEWKEYLTLFEQFPRSDKKPDEHVYRVQKGFGRVTNCDEPPPNIYNKTLEKWTETVLKSWETQSDDEYFVVINTRNKDFAEIAGKKIDNKDKCFLNLLSKSKAILLRREVPCKKGDVKEEDVKEEDGKEKKDKEENVKLFWDEIKKYNDKTCVVITAADLRKVGINIRKTSTFEQAADDFAASMKDERIQALLKYRHLVVLFDDLGVLQIENIDNGNLKKATFHFVPIIKDTEDVKKINSQPERFGTMVGNRLILMASILKGIAWSVRNDGERPFYYLGQSIIQGVGLCHRHLHDGFVLDKDKDKDNDKDKDKYWRWPIMKLFKDEPDKKLLPVATIQVKLDHTPKEAPSKGAWGRVDIIYDLISENDFIAKLHEIVTLGLKEVAKKPLKEGLPEVSPLSALSDELKFHQHEYEVVIPYAQFGEILTADRDEIDRFLDLSLLIQKYLCDEKWKKPLCLAVFGPPGSGKSFTIKEILKSVQSNKSGDPLVYNLAQFNSIEDLISAFHQVQDRALAEEVPLIIFDEFDAQFERPFGWLKYFLAPMQDGVFKGHGGTYQIGRAIFVFAGGMHSTFSDFDKDKDSQDYADFKSAKGPDFISRLRGHLDIKGIDSPNGISNSVMFHRAVVLRSLLEKHAKNIINGKKGKAEIHDELIRAFLKISRYEHGVRSMEAIIQMSQFDKEGFVKASLPRQQQLNMHVNADDFLKLVDLE